MPIYLSYGTVKGAVTADAFKQWIEINSFQFGVGRGISTPTGSAADREASAPSISEITVTKPTDVSSLDLLTDACIGEGVDANIVFCTTVKGGIDEYMRYVLSNTMISGYSVSSGGDRPTESLSLNFTQFQVKFKQNDVLGAKLGSNASWGYNIGTAKPM